MGCLIKKDIIKKTIEFHGHTCPGLAIGIRLSELAMEKLDIKNIQNPVCVTETDMCALDAVQYLTGCTYGKGNLIHKDYGKSAFTFFDRTSTKGFRAIYKSDFRGNNKNNNMGKIMEKITAGSATDHEQKLYQEMRQSSIKKIMDAELDEIFMVTEISKSPVRPARVLNSIECKNCKEMVMESRIRIFEGINLCIPCFIEKEQKI